MTLISPSSVFLVSGGARGITAQCVIRLAKTFPCRWILLGRSQVITLPSWAEDCCTEADLKRGIMQDMQAQGEKPTPIAIQKQYSEIVSSREIRQTLQALEQTGSQAEYCVADVTDRSALLAALSPITARWGAITGVIHGAGTLADKWIEKKTEQDFDRVYATKVTGLENLLKCVNLDDLKHLVLFSSVAGFFGSPGQSDYALANEILNKSAHLIQQHYPTCHVVAINWGPWESGMVTPALKRAFLDRGIEVIPVEVGTQLLVQELQSVDQEAQVVIGSALTPPVAALAAELRNYRIHRHLTVENNPFLLDHTIGESPVLPATCAAHWMISLCEQLYPSYPFSSLEDFRVLKGIVFDGTQADDYIADVQELSKIDAEQITFEVRIWSEKEKGKIRFHYSGQVTLRRQFFQEPTRFLWATSTDKSQSGASFYQNKTLFHGASFQGVQQVVDLTEKTLIAQCYLPNMELQQQGQFAVRRFNPYGVDVALQSVLIWLKQMYGVSALPSEFQQITQFKPFSLGTLFQVLIEVQLKTSTSIVANATIYNEHGEVLMLLSGAKATISQRLLQQFGTLEVSANP
ncbi:SDR family NAD(P)-dependent oxidoreductase [Leptolyngbya sp. AN03gr2]|uniref:SDR family NAD(P)-dependent oxidoreductase n=1 Tax=unclassified Leptolyngbya TaxID=2650499 RepID=UPI003D315598